MIYRLLSEVTPENTARINLDMGLFKLNVTVVL